MPEDRHEGKRNIAVSQIITLPLDYNVAPSTLPTMTPLVDLVNLNLDLVNLANRLDLVNLINLVNFVDCAAPSLTLLTSSTVPLLRPRCSNLVAPNSSFQPCCLNSLLPLRPCFLVDLVNIVNLVALYNRFFPVASLYNRFFPVASLYIASLFYRVTLYRVALLSRPSSLLSLSFSIVSFSIIPF
ncbi:hypothetical protein GGR50DRAFT_699012 [Xylaria sp. CBS 124048]|nr:hypothetical protein GGR50DRAFT_699012 [Xylaria sp. CBS 124048]